MCEVVHVSEPHDVFVGRGSIWGNPYSSRHGTLAEMVVETKQEAVDLYIEYVMRHPELPELMHTLEGKRIACFCRELPCHAVALAKLVNERAWFKWN